MISCMHAFWLNQIGKLSFRDTYHGHKSHDYDHDTDLKTFHTVGVPSRGHHRHITTAKNGQKQPKLPKQRKNGHYTVWAVMTTLSDKIKKV